MRPGRALWIDLLTSSLSASKMMSRLDTMTMHETLSFLDGLHGFLEQACARKGNCCWPTLDQVHLNLRLNRKVFARDQRVYDSFQRQFKIALARHWTAHEPCGPECHTKHLRLTATGVEILQLMNEQGCGPRCAQHREVSLRFEREAA